ncbi:hypothetical protein QZH41_010112, partial [Actinostola sp. cb2023]
IKLGYFLGIAKSILSPSKTVAYLGFISDSGHQVFHLIPEKKEKFIELKNPADGPSRRLSLIDCKLHPTVWHEVQQQFGGKLRAIVHAYGRDGEWDKRFGLGNPAANKSVKDYLRMITAEQLQ